MKDFSCYKRETIEETLDLILTKKGLNFKERCDLITYWLPDLKRMKYVKIGFMEEKTYSQSYILKIEPKPKNLLRICLLFESIHQEEKSTVDLLEENHINFVRDGSTVVEWGGWDLSAHFF